jgi:Peroxidase
MFRAPTTFLRSTTLLASRKFNSTNAKRTETTARNTFGVFATIGLISCYAVSSAASASSCSPNFVALRKEIIEKIDEAEEKRGDGTSMAGTLIRLAWHASGTYSAADKTGGSNGSTQRMEPESAWGANAGLQGARNFLEPLKDKYNMSYADLWTFAGVVAVESMGGPKIPWRSGTTKGITGHFSSQRNCRLSWTYSDT